MKKNLYLQIHRNQDEDGIPGGNKKKEVTTNIFGRKEIK